MERRGEYINEGRNVLRSLAALAGLTILAPVIGEACECIPDTCWTLREYPTIFVGTVLEIQPGSIGEVALFRVDEHLRGIDKTLTKAVVEWLPGFAPMPFEVGKGYLVFPMGSGASMLDGLCCTTTQLVEQAEFELDYLRRLRDERPIPPLFGTVRLDHHSYPGYAPAEGLLVTAKGGSDTFQTRTDAAGRFRFFNLGPGHYTLSPEVPGHKLDVIFDGHVIVDQCNDLDLSYYNDSSVEGRVLGRDGAVLPNEAVVMDVMDTVDQQREPAWHPRTTNADREGKFRFEEIPSGRYRVRAPRLNSHSEQFVVGAGSELLGVEVAAR